MKEGYSPNELSYPYDELWTAVIECGKKSKIPQHPHHTKYLNLPYLKKFLEREALVRDLKLEDLKAKCDYDDGGDIKNYYYTAITQGSRGASSRQVGPLLTIAAEFLEYKNLKSLLLAIVVRCVEDPIPRRILGLSNPILEAVLKEVHADTDPEVRPNNHGAIESGDQVTGNSAPIEERLVSLRKAFAYVLPFGLPILLAVLSLAFFQSPTGGSAPSSRTVPEKTQIATSEQSPGVPDVVTSHKYKISGNLSNVKPQDFDKLSCFPWIREAQLRGESLHPVNIGEKAIQLTRESPVWFDEPAVIEYEFEQREFSVNRQVLTDSLRVGNYFTNDHISGLNGRLVVIEIDQHEVCLLHEFMWRAADSPVFQDPASS